MDGSRQKIDSRPGQCQPGAISPRRLQWRLRLTAESVGPGSRCSTAGRRGGPGPEAHVVWMRLFCFLRPACGSSPVPRIRLASRLSAAYLDPCRGLGARQTNFDARRPTKPVLKPRMGHGAHVEPQALAVVRVRVFRARPRTTEKLKIKLGLTGRTPTRLTRHRFGYGQRGPPDQRGLWSYFVDSSLRVNALLNLVSAPKSQVLKDGSSRGSPLSEFPSQGRAKLPRRPLRCSFSASRRSRRRKAAWCVHLEPPKMLSRWCQGAYSVCGTAIPATWPWHQLSRSWEYRPADGTVSDSCFTPSSVRSLITFEGPRLTFKCLTTPTHAL